MVGQKGSPYFHKSYSPKVTTRKTKNVELRKISYTRLYTPEGKNGEIFCTEYG